MVRHILPSVIQPGLVLATLSTGSAIILEASLAMAHICTEYGHRIECIFRYGHGARVARSPVTTWARAVGDLLGFS